MEKILPLDSPIVASSGGHASGLGSGGRRRVTALCAALVTLGLAQTAGAAPGDLDLSFDADGRVLTHFGAIDGDAPRRSDFATVVAVQPDGKLVVAGGSDVAGFLDVALARYNADGSLDSSFGNGGRVLTDFGVLTDCSINEFVSSAKIEPDGKILVAGVPPGFLFNPDFRTVVLLGRYDPDGSLDGSFGSGGRLLIDVSSVLGGTFNTLYIDTYLQPDSKLVVAGNRTEPLPDGGSSDSDLVLARFNVDGSLDASFGSGGRVITDEDPDNPGPREDYAQLVIGQPDGKLVAAGTSELDVLGAPELQLFRIDFALTRYNPDGSLDESFGSGGHVFTDFDGRIESDASLGFFGTPTDLVVQPDGKLVVGLAVSSFGTLSHSFFLTRFNADGSIDAGFGSSGIVVVVAGFAGGLERLRIAQADGKLVVATVSDAFPGSGSLLTLVRYNGDGSLDTSFGSGGRVRTSFDGRLSTSTASPRGLVVQPDGKLVAVGTSDAGGDADFALARYLVTNERPKPPPRCGGRRATMFGTPGNDTLRGTLFGRDVILGLGGNDTIRGLGGEDILCGGRGNDVLIGGDESDRLFGGAGNDRLFGDLGLSAVDGDDALFGGPGRDTLVGDDGNDLLAGEAGNDRLFGDQGADILDGGVGRDRCKDRFGQNTFNGCDIGSGRRPPEPPRDPIPTACDTRECGSS